MENTSWNTTDEDEITRRKIRAESEKFRIVNNEESCPYYSSFSIASVNSQKSYFVEIRSLDKPLNSCNCPDFQTNGLGTCKHIEAVLLFLRKKGIRKYKKAIQCGNQRVEIFLSRQKGGKIAVELPELIAPSIKKTVDKYFSSDTTLLGNTVSQFEKLQAEIARKTQKYREQIRISEHIQPFISYQNNQLQKQRVKETFLSDVKLGKQSLSLVKYPLLPYQ